MQSRVSLRRCQAVCKFRQHGELFHPDHIKPNIAREAQALALQHHPVQQGLLTWDWKKHCLVVLVAALLDTGNIILALLYPLTLIDPFLGNAVSCCTKSSSLLGACMCRVSMEEDGLVDGGMGPAVHRQ